MNRRRIASAGFMSLLVACPVAAQQWPSKAIRIVNPTAPGGPADVMARSVGQKLTEAFGQTVVIDNRPGANGIIGVEIAARAAPDGYTLLAGTNGQMVVNPAVFPKLPFDSTRDFAPITIVMASPFMLCVHPSIPARSVRDLVALARARPGQLAYSSFGPASVAHLAMELFALRTGTRLTHVPYKGGAPAAAALVSGEVAALFDSVQNQTNLIRSQRVRALAIAAGTRSKVFPDVPTLAEAGVPGVEAGGWYALFAPAGTPAGIVARLHEEVVKAFQSTELRDRFESTGSELVLNSPEQFAARIRTEIALWSKVAREANVKVE